MTAGWRKWARYSKCSRNMLPWLSSSIPRPAILSLALPVELSPPTSRHSLPHPLRFHSFSLYSIPSDLYPSYCLYSPPEAIQFPSINYLWGFQPCRGCVAGIYRMLGSK